LNCSTCKRTQWPTFNAHRPATPSSVVHHALFVEKKSVRTVTSERLCGTHTRAHLSTRALQHGEPPSPCLTPMASGRAWMSSAHSRPWPVRHDSRDSSGHAACAFSTAPSQESHAGAECARLRECVCGVLLVAAKVTCRTLRRLHGHAASPRGAHGEHLSELFRACVAACALPSTLPQPFTAMMSPRCSV
jgi:hypothetical protein